MTLPISLSTVVAASKKQLTCDLSGEAAILHLDSGRYFGLDPVGARIWALVQQPRSVRALCDVILEEYEVEPDRCERDVLQLLESLSGAGLIEIRDGSTASSPDQGG